VSYQERHNLANGEDNRDGHQGNHSWNCGVEGASNDALIEQRRARLQRSLLASLLLAQGTPMLLAGDELGHSQSGNNNAYCQDNPLTWLDWSAAQPGLADCVARLTALRRRHVALRPERWLSGRPDARGWRDVVWLRPEGRELHGADWSDTSQRAIAVRLIAPQTAMPAGAGDEAGVDDVALLLFINPQPGPCNFVIAAGRWQVEFCSSRADGAPPPHEHELRGGIWSQPGHSLTVLRAALHSLGTPDVAPVDVAAPAAAPTGAGTPATGEDRSDEP
jgi:glycogen operon protein